MTRWFCCAMVLAGALGAGGRTPESRLIAHYPLDHDLNDVTDHHGPLQAKNALLQPGKGLFCNGRYADPGGCDVRTPQLDDFNPAAFRSARNSGPRATCRIRIRSSSAEGAAAGSRMSCCETLLLRNLANSTTFHGALRDLKIYDGVVVPTRRTPVADDMPDPTLQALASVDRFLLTCPTPEQLAGIDADLPVRGVFADAVVHAIDVHGGGSRRSSTAT
jgi:hypothetical protein